MLTRIILHLNGSWDQKQMLGSTLCWQITRYKHTPFGNCKFLLDITFLTLELYLITHYVKLQHDFGLCCLYLELFWWAVTYLWQVWEGCYLPVAFYSHFTGVICSIVFFNMYYTTLALITKPCYQPILIRQYLFWYFQISLRCNSGV